jgi:hypothetical protein
MTVITIVNLAYRQTVAMTGNDRNIAVVGHVTRDGYSDCVTVSSARRIVETAEHRLSSRWTNVCSFQLWTSEKPLSFRN